MLATNTPSKFSVCLNLHLFCLLLILGIKCVGVLNEMWYRVEVMSIDVSAPVHATVKLIDWGRMENLPLTK